MHFDLQVLEARDIYTLLSGVIVPRPIALVTTLDEAGLVNAAPFSYFNLLGTDPPIIALGLGDRPDGTPKDTARNIRARGEFVVNIVDEDLAKQMNICAVPFAPGQSEVEAAQLEVLDSVQVKPPRLAASPVSLECREHLTLHIGRNRVVLAQVLGVHAREDVVDARSLRADAHRLRAIGRLGGHGYARTDDGFEMPRPSLEDWNR